MSLRFCTSWNQAWTLCAISGPIPSTAFRSSTEAAARRSADGYARASTWATWLPTCGMLSATSRRHSGRSFDASIALIRLSIDFSLNPGSWATWSGVSEYTSAGSFAKPTSKSAMPVL